MPFLRRSWRAQEHVAVRKLKAISTCTLRLTIAIPTACCLSHHCPWLGQLVKSWSRDEVQQKCLEELRERHIKTHNHSVGSNCPMILLQSAGSVGQYGPIASVLQRKPPLADCRCPSRAQVGGAAHPRRRHQTPRRRRPVLLPGVFIHVLEIVRGA